MSIHAGIGALPWVDTFLGSLMQAVKTEDYIATAHHIGTAQWFSKGDIFKDWRPSVHSYVFMDIVRSSWLFATYCS
jgi:hypothetical protein